MGAGLVIVLSWSETVKETSEGSRKKPLPPYIPPGAYRPRIVSLFTDAFPSLEERCKVFADKNLPPVQAGEYMDGTLVASFRSYGDSMPRP